MTSFFSDEGGPIWIKFHRLVQNDMSTWWIHCHDSRTTCHIAGCKNSIRHIENRFSPYFIFVLFLMQFRLWRAAAFVSSPIHLFYSMTVTRVLLHRAQDRFLPRDAMHLSAICAVVLSDGSLTACPSDEFMYSVETCKHPQPSSPAPRHSSSSVRNVSAKFRVT